jgi:MoaA/NifB/PqqE/SkfB family radical SAM enzyme
MLETRDLQYTDGIFYKKVLSSDYKYLFNKRSGFFYRTGKTSSKEHEPDFAPFPEILDIEISTICHQNCKHCYKSNTHLGKNMSFETFKKMFDTFPKELTQVAFGIGDITEWITGGLVNPDIFKIMEYCRENSVIPNITINGYRMIDEYYDKLAEIAGAISVSMYDYDVCCNAVQELIKRKANQVNIHFMLSQETYNIYKDKLFNIKNEKRLENLNAIVFLLLKQKGRGTNYHTINFEGYKNLVLHFLENKINFGSDSCGAAKLKHILKETQYENQFNEVIESCESSCFSGYINVNGIYFPCSFTEGANKWKTGLNVLESDNFVEQIWNHPKNLEFRNNLLKTKDENGCKNCPIFRI